jgi:hypothetical protein
LPWNVDDAASRSADCDGEIATRQVLKNEEKKFDIEKGFARFFFVLN